MIKDILTFLLFAPLIGWAQWRATAIPIAHRYDDVFFINQNDGWAVNSRGKVYKTTDGGEQWSFNFEADAYLRSIEFATPELGYIGSLSSTIYRTQDGGDTWVDISDNIPFDITKNGLNYDHVPGACGLSAPSPAVIYACGIWSGEVSYVTKSIDGGDSWTTYDMTRYATKLVDIMFFNDLEGFAAGTNDDSESDNYGGVILHTIDGGETWTTVLSTNMAEDYIWKLQTPDSINVFGSITSLPFANDVRFAKSTDSGKTWGIQKVRDDKWTYIQAIGFKDALTGWTGGTFQGENGAETALYETNDGGVTWQEIAASTINTFNRIYMFNDQSIFMSGSQVYIYDQKQVIEEEEALQINEHYHQISASPNPTSHSMTIDVSISQFTRTNLDVFDVSGKQVKSIQSGFLNGGKHQFSVDLSGLKTAVYLIRLHTNEGLNILRVVKK
jgi:photosystem II stability/assembly factor-like uncharacterized protein